MEGKKILEVFRTYTDAYLDYINNWLDYNNWAKHYGFTFTESQTLLNAVNEMRKDDRESPWMVLDYYYNVVNNKDYSEIDAIF